MLKRFSVRNYKNFKDTLELDLGRVGGYKFNEDCILGDAEAIGKAVIYGRNASGKSNLGEAVYDICSVADSKYLSSDYSLNAESDELMSFFEYEFVFCGRTVLYKYSRNELSNALTEDFFVDEKKVFSSDTEMQEINIYDTDIINNSAAVEKYKLFLNDVYDEVYYENEVVFEEPNRSFLWYYLNNTHNEKDSILSELEAFIRGMNIFNLHQQTDYSRNYLLYNKLFLNCLEKEGQLAQFEKFLNEMGVPCELYLEKISSGMNELYFKYKNKYIPFFSTASSGTISLVNFYKRFLDSRRKITFMYLDEFDAFYHYEMAERVVKYIKKYFPEAQVIFTTHNTNLMTNRLMRPDCLFILSQKGYITPLCDATERELREGHNLEKLYISGEFMDYE